MAWLIVIPAVFAILRLVTRKYAFSALTTLSCAALVAARAPVMAAALAVSAVGDYFMAHKGNRESVYALGIAGFFVGHALFIAQAVSAARPRAIHWVVLALLAALYGAYFLLRAMPRMPKSLRLPGALYTAISVAGFACALMTGSACYAVGIGLLLFSDTMIAENDFLGNHQVAALILPAYYLCHILVALSALI